jgi:hypothetical protein
MEQFTIAEEAFDAWQQAYAEWRAYAFVTQPSYANVLSACQYIYGAGGNVPYPYYGFVSPQGSGLNDYPTGRRLRVLVRLHPPTDMPLPEYMVAAEQLRGLVDPYGHFPLRISGYPQAMITEPSTEPSYGDARMHPALRDLAYEILEDLQEACAAFDNADVWYPGVDDGIEPVTDDHVRLVTWATQRELDRELRQSRKPGGGTLPAVVLADLPWRIQRAFAERRRLRYQEWGIGRKQWEANTWSLFDVPVDEDYRSRREARGLAEENDSRVIPPA